MVSNMEYIALMHTANRLQYIYTKHIINRVDWVRPTLGFATVVPDNRTTFNFLNVAKS